MSRLRRTDVVVWALAVAAPLALAGCGGGGDDDLPRQAVSGTVTFRGQPLKAGMIQFVPADAAATTAGGSAVTDGRYAVARSEGLVPGKYQVMITSAAAAAAEEAAGKAVMPGDAPPPPKEPIPARYNVKSELTAVVTREGPNTFNFTLQAR